MKIIIKTDLVSKVEKTINVFYGENNVYIEKWINDYLNKEIDIMKLEPDVKNTSDIEYYVEMCDSLFYLVKKHKLLLKGYVYNKYETICERLRCIKTMEFDGVVNNVETLGCSLWKGINSDINHRVMREIDHASLLQVNMKFEDALKTKELWSSTELVMLQTDIIKVHKKKLYSSILKKVKKFNKKSVETSSLVLYF